MFLRFIEKCIDTRLSCNTYCDTVTPPMMSHVDFLKRTLMSVLVFGSVHLLLIGEFLSSKPWGSWSDCLCKKQSGSQLWKLFHTYLRLKFVLLINIKMPTFVGILIFISRLIFMFCWVEHEKFFTALWMDLGLHCLEMHMYLHSAWQIWKMWHCHSPENYS